MLQKNIVILVLLLVFLTGVDVCAQGRGNTIPLDGVWKFRLDGEDVGVAEKWFAREV